MEIKFVSRSKINSSNKRNSKFKPLLEAIDKLKPGGQALEVSYSNDRNVNSMRTAVYQHSRSKGVTVKSKKHPEIKKIHFYREE